MANFCALPAFRWPLDRQNPTSAAKFLIALAFFSAFAANAQTPHSPPPPQPLAITFDDLPNHGPRPPAISRLQIVQSILATLQRGKLPPAYGFINAVKTEEHPGGFEILRAWRAAGQPLANHT